MNESIWLLTGATGFIGRWLLRELESKGYPLILLLRRPQVQAVELRSWLQAHGVLNPAFTVVAGDLEQPGWGLSEQDRRRLEQVTGIFHLATRFAWGMTAADARRANVTSLDTLLALVDANPHLQRLVWVGGYMAGNPKLQPVLQQLREGLWQPVYLRLGAYEASKLESYVKLQDALTQRAVPWTFVHPSTVIGASDSGEISQDIGLLKLLDALQKGRLAAVPGRAEDWLPIVAVDYLARFIAGVIEQPAAVDQEYWVLDDGTPRLTELVVWLAQGLDLPAPRSRIPLWLMKFILKAGLGKRWGMSAESLNFIDSARYNTCPAQTLAQQMGLTMPHTRTTVEKMVGYWQRQCADDVRRKSPLI
jgi:dihydroflavonol-4-reductase